MLREQVISCEMIEAVGHENLPAYFGAISSLLKPGGQAVIQVSTLILHTLTEAASEVVNCTLKHKVGMPVEECFL